MTLTKPVELELQLARGVGAPAQARKALRAACAGILERDLLTDGELLVSELVTNALRHGEGRIVLIASLDDDRLRVEVVDAGSGFERDLRRRDIGEIGGRGLEIVEQAASRWGVHEGTTHVWFELERRGPRLGEPE